MDKYAYFFLKLYYACMLSLYVKSPFTNLTMQWVLYCLEKKLRQFHYSSIEIEILNLIHLHVRQIIFVFNDVFHSQIDGLGMGSPLFPLFCNIYMFYFGEGKRKKNLFSVRKFPHWFRYLDHTFLLVLSNANSSSLINSIDRIQFIFEIKRTILFRFLVFCF